MVVTKKKDVRLPTGGAREGAGRPPDGNEALSVPRSIRLSPSVDKRAQRLCKRSGESFNAFVNRLISEADTATRKSA